MAVTLALSVDAQAGFTSVAAAFGRLPAKTELAQRRALKKLATWLKRQVLRAASQAAGIPQKWFESAMRYYVTVTPDGLSVWTGTDPVKAHRLGKVRWTKRMAGARAGRRPYPGTWSWGRGKTGPAIMQRLGSRRLPIATVIEPIHDPILARLQGLQAEATARFERILTQELNYALNVEARA